MKSFIKNRILTDKIVTLTLCGCLVSLFALYMYLIGASVVHVVIRKEVNQDLVTLHTEISLLETAYIESQHRVSDEIASLEGYETIVSKVFIDRTPSSLVLSTNPR